METTKETIKSKWYHNRIFLVCLLVVLIPTMISGLFDLVFVFPFISPNDIFVPLSSAYLLWIISRWWKKKPALYL